MSVEPYSKAQRGIVIVDNGSAPAARNQSTGSKGPGRTWSSSTPRSTLRSTPAGATRPRSTSPSPNARSNVATRLCPYREPVPFVNESWPSLVSAPPHPLRRGAVGPPGSQAPGLITPDLPPTETALVAAGSRARRETGLTRCGVVQRSAGQRAWRRIVESVPTVQARRRTGHRVPGPPRPGAEPRSQRA